jgi:hypothetical protein
VGDQLFDSRMTVLRELGQEREEKAIAEAGLVAGAGAGAGVEAPKTPSKGSNKGSPKGFSKANNPATRALEDDPDHVRLSFASLMLFSALLCSPCFLFCAPISLPFALLCSSHLPLSALISFVPIHPPSRTNSWLPSAGK